MRQRLLLWGALLGVGTLAFFGGRLSLGGDLDRSEAQVVQAEADLLTMASELQATSDRLAVKASDADAAIRLVADLDAKNRALEKQLTELEAEAKPFYTCTELRPFGELPTRLRASAVAINPSASLNPPLQDPMGQFSIDLTNARMMMGEAANALERYDEACTP